MAVLAAAGLAACGGDETLDAPVAEPTPVADAAVVAPARAEGVVVDQPAVDLGSVPLDVVVRHTFHLRNEGLAPVRLGAATIAVLEGC